MKDLDEEKFRLVEKNSELRQKLKTKEILDNLIEPTARKAFWFMICYSVFVGGCIVADAFFSEEFNVPEAVLIYLVGSTAATVVGLFGMVLTGIFLGARK